VGWIADYPHPAIFYHALLCDPGNLGYGPMDTTLCDQLEAAFEETEFSAQLAIYQWASGRINNTLPLLPIGHGQGPFITRNDVAGVRFTPYHGVDFANAYYVPSTITGNAFLQGRADHSGIMITAWYGGVLANATTTPYSGAYALTVPTATYTVTFDMPRYLDAATSGVPAAAGEIVLLPDQTLRCGDSNDDDIVNILDMALMGSHFHLICDDVDWDERADLNADCIVNILDLSCGAGN
jgi:hypothetical protein